eukprot:TRINITY_DN2153_c0_g1_i1.p1 TRINITY_DN2153_c0_g1~~TRINITY_DN2153_c0_g1_i1.p1  ORF type:complete len:332 (+),score=90.56 TRINITY_DN2153_c0_g1_i1:57-998(+)
MSGAARASGEYPMLELPGGSLEPKLDADVGDAPPPLSLQSLPLPPPASSPLLYAPTQHALHAGASWNAPHPPPSQPAHPPPPPLFTPSRLPYSTDTRRGRERVQRRCPNCGAMNHIRKNNCAVCDAPKQPAKKRSKRARKRPAQPSRASSSSDARLSQRLTVPPSHSPRVPFAHSPVTTSSISQHDAAASPHLRHAPQQPHALLQQHQQPVPALPPHVLAPQHSSFQQPQPQPPVLPHHHVMLQPPQHHHHHHPLSQHPLPHHSPPSLLHHLPHHSSAPALTPSTSSSNPNPYDSSPPCSLPHHSYHLPDAAP